MGPDRDRGTPGGHPDAPLSAAAGHVPGTRERLCTRPAELDCRMESACETCTYFRTGTQFLPILTRQRDHARDHGQTDRAALPDGLIHRAEGQAP
jgi:hypothetical protein